MHQHDHKCKHQHERRQRRYDTLQAHCCSLQNHRPTLTHERKPNPSLNLHSPLASHTGSASTDTFTFASHRCASTATSNFHEML